jgi:hypothetical protein
MGFIEWAWWFMVHTSRSSMLEAKAEGSQVQDQCGILSKCLRERQKEWRGRE